MNKRYRQLIFGILLILGLVAAVILVRRIQEIRRGAFFASKKLELLPNEDTKKIGDDILVHLQVSNVGDTGSKVDNIRSVVCYNDALVDVDSTIPSKDTVSINDISNNIFDQKYLVKVYSLSGRCSGPDRADTGTACFGNVVKKCNHGLWEDKENCTASSKTCFDPAEEPASCVTSLPVGRCSSPDRANGGTACFGNVLKKCNSGTWGTETDCTTSGKTCVDPAGAPASCIVPTTPSPTPALDGNTVTKCVDLTIGSNAKSVGLKNNGEFAIVHLKAKALGSGKVKILKDYTQVSGDNITDPSIQVDSVSDLAYTITAGTTITPTGIVTPTIVPGTGPVLNFKVAFNLSYPTATCANWKVQVKVNGKDGSSKTYDDVSLTNTGSANPKNGYTIYTGSVRLVDFTQTSDLAVFIRGPKHLTTKYGMDNQTSFYNQLNGQIGGLTDDSSTSPTFDFSNYPLLAGDVVGATVSDKVQNGVINGIDFSYVKAQTTLRVTGGGDLLADLNGDCSLGSVDTGVLTQSLIDKQEQTY